MAITRISCCPGSLLPTYPGHTPVVCGPLAASNRTCGHTIERNQTIGRLEPIRNAISGRIREIFDAVDAKSALNAQAIAILGEREPMKQYKDPKECQRIGENYRTVSDQ